MMSTFIAHCLLPNLYLLGAIFANGRENQPMEII